MKEPSTIQPRNDFHAGPAFSSFLYLQYLYDKLEDVVCALDIDGHFIHVSAPSESLWGYKPEELIGRHYLEFVAEEDHQKTLKASEQLIAGSATADFENRYKRKDGTLVPVRWWGRWDAREKVLFCVARNATEKKLLQSLQLQFAQKVKQNNRQIANVLERITDGFLALDNDWRVIYWNGQSEKMTGKKREDMLARNLWDCYPEQNIEIFRTHYQQAVTEMKPVHFDYCTPRSNYWFEFSVYPAKEGLSIFFRDVTERKRAEEELKKLSLIARETSNAVIIKDALGQITWINNAFTEMTGFTGEEVTGRKLEAFLPGPETDTDTVAFMKECVAAGKPFQTELLYYSKDGELFWTEIQCQPVLDESGKVQQFFSFLTDTTDRKLLQQQLDEELEERQKKITTAVIQAQERERTAIGRDLHDNINQVLTTVKLYNELCLNNPDKGSELLHKSIQLLNGTISEIRSISKKLSAPTLGKIHLHETVKELIDSIETASSLAITLDAPDMEELHLPEEMHTGLYRILQEHMTNIIRHAKAETVHLTLRRTPKNLSLLVVDDGIGFNPHENRTGVGLPNMISRAESLGGSLRLISSPGNGCTLLVSIPLV